MCHIGRELVHISDLTKEYGCFEYSNVGGTKEMLKLAWKYMKGYKKHSVACITGIAISVMLIFSLIGISDRIMGQYQNMIWSMVSTYDVKIKDIDTKQMEEIYKDIFPADCKKLMNQWCGAIYTENGIPIYLLAMEGDWENFHKTELAEGRFPEKEYEICVEERFVKEYDVKIADVLNYELYDDAGKSYKVNFEVTGIIKDLPVASSEKYIFTNYKTSVDLARNHNFMADNSNNSLLVEFDKYTINEERINTLNDKLLEKYGIGFLGKNCFENEEKWEIYLEKDGFLSFGSAFYGICAVVFLCMTMFVYNAISINMTEKIRQYGMLRCIGISNKKMIVMMLIEQISYALVGTFVGLIGGKLLNTVVADKLVEGFGVVLDSKLKESVWTYLITVVVVLIAVLTAFGAMLVKMCKQKPIEMLRHMEDIKDVSVKKKSTNVILDMAGRNINRNPSKSRIMVSTIFVATLLMVLIGNAITSINFNLNKTLSAIAQVEVAFVFGAQEKPFVDKETIERIEKNDVVEEIYWQKKDNNFDILVDGQESDELSSIIVYSDNLMKKFLQFNNVKNVDLSDDIAIVLKNNEMDNISEVKLQAEEEYTITIHACVPITQSALLGEQIGYSPCVIMNETLATKILGEITGYTNIFLDMKEGADVSKIKEMTGTDEYIYVDLSNVQADAQNQLMAMIIMALYMLLSVIILNLFVISNTIKSNISLRQKEIGMLRSIGAEKGWIEKVISDEIMILTVRGLLAGVVVSIPISLYIYLVINESMGIGYGGFLVGIPIIIFGVYFISKMIIKSCLKGEITEMIRNE